MDKEQLEAGIERGDSDAKKKIIEFVHEKLNDDGDDDWDYESEGDDDFSSDDTEDFWDYEGEEEMTNEDEEEGE